MRDKVKEGVLSVRYVPTGEQLVDLMTKPLLSTRFIALRGKLPVVPTGSFQGG